MIKWRKIGICGEPEKVNLGLSPLIGRTIQSSAWQSVKYCFNFTTLHYIVSYTLLVTDDDK